MRLPKSVGLVDLATLTVLFVAVVLPPREMYGRPAMDGTEAEHFALAHAEARTLVRPEDPVAYAELSRKLSKGGFLDWAIESALDGVARTEKSPEHWRTLLATSVAYVDRLDVQPALEYANKALTACVNAACPSWEMVRIQLYQAHLEAGVKSGIDPRTNPKGFQQAGQNNLRVIRLGDPAK